MRYYSMDETYFISNSPTIDEFNSWSLNDKAVFIIRNYSASVRAAENGKAIRSWKVVLEVIKGRNYIRKIPKGVMKGVHEYFYVQRPTPFIIRFLFNYEKKLQEAVAMPVESGEADYNIKRFEMRN